MILAKLKESTRDQHENLEKVVNVMESGFTRGAYERLLARFYQFYRAIEPKFVGSGIESTGFDLTARLKTHLLEADLKNLGIFNSRDQIAPVLTALPEIDSPAKAFGTLYVLEGATLGGQIITRHLKQHLGIDNGSGCSFFNSYGDQVGPMWKKFGAAITAFAEQNGDDEAIVQAARDTFDAFAEYFSSAQVDRSIAQTV